MLVYSFLQQVLVRFERFAPVSQIDIVPCERLPCFWSDALVRFSPFRAVCSLMSYVICSNNLFLKVLFLFLKRCNFLAVAAYSQILWTSSCGWLRFALVPFEQFAPFLKCCGPFRNCPICLTLQSFSSGQQLFFRCLPLARFASFSSKALVPSSGLLLFLESSSPFRAIWHSF